MALEDSLRNSREKAGDLLKEVFPELKGKTVIPLSYRRRAGNVQGKVHRQRYDDPDYASEVSRLRKKYTRFLEMGRNESEGRYDGFPEDLMDYQELSRIVPELYGKNVVIRDGKGFHYGKLLDFDGKNFYLDGYLFARKMMGESAYSNKSFFSGKRAVRAGHVASIEEIPSDFDVYDPEQFISDTIDAMAAERLYGRFKGQKDISFKDFFYGKENKTGYANRN